MKGGVGRRTARRVVLMLFGLLAVAGRAVFGEMVRDSTSGTDPPCGLGQRRPQSPPLQGVSRDGPLRTPVKSRSRHYPGSEKPAEPPQRKRIEVRHLVEWLLTCDIRLGDARFCFVGRIRPAWILLAVGVSPPRIVLLRGERRRRGESCCVTRGALFALIVAVVGPCSSPA